MRQIAVTMHEDVIRGLDEIASSLSKPRSVIIREAILKYLIEVKKTNPQIFEPYTFKSIHD